MEQDAFHQIYETYAGQVYLFLRKLSGSPDLAEELTQEAFVRAYLHLDGFRGDCSLYAWLCQIGKNLYWNYLKKESRYTALPELSVTDPVSETVEEQVLARDGARQLAEAVKMLPEPYYSVFVYRLFSELSYEEIGRLLSQSPVWTRVTYYRARQKLQTILKEEFDYEM